MSKVLGSILPIAGTLIGGYLLGGPAGAALGGALGGAGGAAITHQNILQGGLLGGAGGLASGALAGMAGAGAGATLAEGGTVGGAQVADPIEAMWQAVQQTGAQGTTQAAQQMGYNSVGDMLTAANPGWSGITSPMGGGGTGTPASAPSTTGALGSMLSRAGINIPGVTTGAAPNFASMTAAAGAPGLGTTGTVLGGLSGAAGLYQALQMQQLAQAAGQRTGSSSQAEAQLQALLANPNSVSNMPGFAAGSEAVQRAMAAQGYTGSGNAMTALQNYGTQFFNNQAQVLSGLAQAGAPQYGTALQGMNLSNQAASAALGTLGYTAQRGGF